MASEADIIEVVQFFKAAGLKKAPRSVHDVSRVYHQILQNQPIELLEKACASWCQDPDHGQWFPSAPELLNLCLLIEAGQRAQAKDSQRGCMRCGELLDDEGGIQSPGSGYRDVIQRCYPRNEHGDVDWDAAPYRVGVRKILCDCDKGRHIGHTQRTAEMAHAPKGWRPTLTIQEAGQRFRRADARLYVTGSPYRANSRDTDPRSPFFSQPSPEEKLTDADEAVRQRAMVDGVLEGIIPREAASFLVTAAKATRSGIPADFRIAGGAA